MRKDCQSVFFEWNRFLRMGSSKSSLHSRGFRVGLPSWPPDLPIRPSPAMRRCPWRCCRQNPACREPTKHTYNTDLACRLTMAAPGHEPFAKTISMASLGASTTPNGMSAHTPSPGVHTPGSAAQATNSCGPCTTFKTVWPSGLRRWLQAPVRKGVGSNPTAVILPQWIKLPPSPLPKPSGPRRHFLVSPLRRFPLPGLGRWIWAMQFARKGPTRI